jgi:adenosylcobinamide kinase/adenosylcobinamide-phosphate guanylyltransferase
MKPQEKCEAGKYWVRFFAWSQDFSKMLTLILGGARSGKSRLAQRVATTASKTGEGANVTYVATYHAGNDPEMRERIARHRASRPASWSTIEEPVELAATVEKASRDCGVILVDCLTIWLSNLFWEHRERSARHMEEVAQTEVNRIAALSQRCDIVLVSNEVGSGVVPEHALARAFRDTQGLVNQWAAEVADEVILTVAGLPLYLKKHPPRKDPSTREHAQ